MISFSNLFMINYRLQTSINNCWILNTIECIISKIFKNFLEFYDELSLLSISPSDFIVWNVLIDDELSKGIVWSCCIFSTFEINVDLGFIQNNDDELVNFFDVICVDEFDCSMNDNWRQDEGKNFSFSYDELHRIIFQSIVGLFLYY